MYVEIPEFRKCCCIPVRRSLLIFGYIGMFTSMLWFLIEALQSGVELDELSITTHKGVSFYVRSWLVQLLNLTDIAFNIVLVIGAHKKQILLLRVYFYYGIVTIVAGVVLFLVTRADVYQGMYILHIEEAAFAIFWFGLQTFILLLVRSGITKLDSNGGFRYVNHAEEVVVDVPDCEGNNPF